MPRKPPKYPRVWARLGNLLGPEGNAFVVLGRCETAARESGLDEAAISEFRREATSGDYDHLLRVCRAWFKCSSR
jgi:hypothetical protein